METALFSSVFCPRRLLRHPYFISLMRIRSLIAHTRIRTAGLLACYFLFSVMFMGCATYDAEPYDQERLLEDNATPPPAKLTREEVSRYAEQCEQQREDQVGYFPPPSDETRLRFEEAIRAYNEGSYLSSAREMEALFEETRNPTLLLNAARAYERSGEVTYAIYCYRRLMRSTRLDRQICTIAVARLGELMELEMNKTQGEEPSPLN